MSFLLSAIEGFLTPTTVVSRETDNVSQAFTSKFGLIVETKVPLKSIGATISNNTVDATTAYLHNYDDVNDKIGNLIDTVSISSNTAGDAFAFKNVNLNSGEKIMLLLDAEGAQYTVGYYDVGANFPYESDELAITARWNGGDGLSDSVDPVAINDVGNSGLN